MTQASPQLRATDSRLRELALPTRATALHQSAGQWRMVTLERATDSRLRESVPAAFRLVDTRTLPMGATASGAGLRAQSALAGAKPTRHETTADFAGRGAPLDSLLHVLPASRVVCRVVEAPAGSEEDTASALNLLAEATLPAGLPPHRRAAGLIPSRNRVALLIGWPCETDANSPPTADSGAGDAVFTAAPAALIFLLARLGGRAAVHADRNESSLCICLNTPPRPIVRALREFAETDEEWKLLVRERISQTLASLAPEHALALESMLGGAPLDSPTLLLDPAAESALREAISNLPDDPDWLHAHGVALAATLAQLEAPAAFRPLLSLTSDAPRRRESGALRAARFLAEPRRAAAAVALSAASALLGPLAIAAARSAALTSRTGGLAAVQESERREALRSALADELERRRWPMTRLFAHLAGATPTGITLESVRFDAGQRAAVRGRAGSLDLVNQLQSRLNNSGVFADASIDRTQNLSNESGVDFDLTFRVVRPYSPPKGLDDFASVTLAQRLYGERAAHVSFPSPDDFAAAPRSSQSAVGRSRAPASPPPPKVEIPPPLSDADIARLDAAAAMKEWTSRQRASKQPGLDAGTRDRLTAESQKARERMLAARKEAAQ